MKHKKKKNQGCFNCCTAVQIIFIILKLAHVVDWSWNVTFAPTYISLFGGITGIILTVALEAWRNMNK